MFNTPSTRIPALAIGLTLSLGLISQPAQAQGQAGAYPSQTIRMVVPFPPGGGTDILARLIGQRLGEAHPGWNIVPDNKAGAGGTLGLSEAAKGKPDGYHMVMGQKDNLVVGPWLYQGLPWHPVKDFRAVAHVAWTPVIIATRADGPYKTLAEVVAAAKAAPDTITYGSPGNGTTIHLAGDQFGKAAGIQLRHVPYKGSNPALMDALAGNVDLLVSSVPSAMAQVKAGKLRPLAVTSAKRSTALPQVPTVAESGYPGFDLSTWYGLLMPAGTPDAPVQTINAAVNQLLAKPEVQKALHEQGAEPQAMSPEDFARQIQTEHQAMEKIVREAGVKLQ